MSEDWVSAFSPSTQATFTLPTYECPQGHTYTGYTYNLERPDGSYATICLKCVAEWCVTQGFILTEKKP
jgi:hypothetical protein